MVPTMCAIYAFDLDATLERLDGDRVLFRELIRFFFEDSPIVLDQLKASLRDGNISATERAAHSLKGLTANIGSGRRASRLAGSKRGARNKDLTNACSMLGDLERELVRLTAALKQF